MSTIHHRQTHHITLSHTHTEREKSERVKDIERAISTIERICERFESRLKKAKSVDIDASSNKIDWLIDYCFYTVSVSAISLSRVNILLLPISFTFNLVKINEYKVSRLIQLCVCVAWPYIEWIVVILMLCEWSDSNCAKQLISPCEWCFCIVLILIGQMGVWECRQMSWTTQSVYIFIN